MHKISQSQCYSVTYLFFYCSSLKAYSNAIVHLVTNYPLVPGNCGLVLGDVPHQGNTALSHEAVSCQGRLLYVRMSLCNIYYHTSYYDVIVSPLPRPSCILHPE